jgi:NitT/TauT family transport system permease protein
MFNQFIETVWQPANTVLLPLRRRRIFMDAIVVLGLMAMVYGLVIVGRQWTGVHRPVVEIDLSPWALPRYTFYSMMRGLAAYVLSLAFTLVYAYWAAKDDRAEKLLIPILDILQSIPVLGFMPGLVLALVVLFPRTNLGLELAAVIMIFTGQAWNMTFSLYHSLKTVPAEFHEAATTYGFNWWERLKWVELPFGTTGLVWNSMMSMAGGWFFLMITEAFQLGDQDFRLPGLGSYMSVAVDKGSAPAMIYSVIAMIVMIVFLDQMLWRPVVVMAQRFRIEDTSQGNPPHSWLLKILRRSRLVRFVAYKWAQRRIARANAAGAAVPRTPAAVQAAQKGSRWLANLALVVLMALVVWGSVALVRFLTGISRGTWFELGKAGGVTMARVLASSIIGTLWTVPAGLAIGLSDRMSRFFQPIVQVAASFPAPMLFPVVILLMASQGIGLTYGCVVLMLLGTQWYILFNVIAGAMAIPSDMREVATCFHFTRWERFTRVYMPACFPYLVTGWVTAAGGAWNASIVAEYYQIKGQTLSCFGLGSTISKAAYDRNLTLLAASCLLMSAMVVVFNRLVWKRLYRLAFTRYTLDK